MPAPVRQRIKTFLTPKIEDFLIAETVDVSRIAIPEYGTPHPDNNKYPYHRFCYATAADETGLIDTFLYAMPRENQDDYNWDIGTGVELTRTYLVERSKYYGRSAAEATADPLDNDEFTHPEVATADIRFSDYGFADDTVLDAPEELRSLFVIVKRRFLRPEIVEIRYEETFGLRLKTTYTLVPASYTDADLPADTVGVVYELEPVNSFHSRQITREVVPESDGWTLADYARAQAIRTDIPNLPRELVSVGVVWNSQYSIGTQDYFYFKTVTGETISLGKNADDSASSAASIVPELQIKFRDVEASNLPATEYEIFIAGDATEAAVIDRLEEILSPATVTPWPVFRPESTTINTNGQSINVRVNVGVGLAGVYSTADGLTMYESERATSDDFSVNLTVGGVQLPACIHGDITLTGGTSRSQLVAATAAMSISNSLVGSSSVTKTKSGTAYGIVTPAVIPAVSGEQTIPTSGLYAIAIRPGRNFLGFTQVTAIVFDAANLA